MACIFCQIIDRKIESQIVAETAAVLVIKDHAPKAPIHYLIIPKKHVHDINSLESQDLVYAQHLFAMAQHISKTVPQAREYKLLINNGHGAGQRVFHLHMHLLAGQTFDHL